MLPVGQTEGHLGQRNGLKTHTRVVTGCNNIGEVFTLSDSTAHSPFTFEMKPVVSLLPSSFCFAALSSGCTTPLIEPVCSGLALACAFFKGATESRID